MRCFVVYLNLAVLELGAYGNSLTVNFLMGKSPSKSLHLGHQMASKLLIFYQPIAECHWSFVIGHLSKSPLSFVLCNWSLVIGPWSFVIC